MQNVIVTNHSFILQLSNITLIILYIVLADTLISILYAINNTHLRTESNRLSIAKIERQARHQVSTAQGFPARCINYQTFKNSLFWKNFFSNFSAYIKQIKGLTALWRRKFWCISKSCWQTTGWVSHVGLIGMTNHCVTVFPHKRAPFCALFINESWNRNVD